MNVELQPQNEILKTSPEAAAEFRDTLPSKETLATLGDKKDAYDVQLSTLAASKEATTSELSQLREKLGLPALTETPPSVQHIEDKMKLIEEERNKTVERHQELITEQEKEKLIEVEKLRLLNEEIADLKNAFLKLSPDMQSSILMTGIIPEGAMLHLPPGMNASDPELFRNQIAQILEDKVITKEDLDAKSETLRTIAEKAEDEAEKNVDTAVAHLEATNGPDILTDTDRQILREADELLIGYESGSYTPSSLLKRIEEQNAAVEKGETELSATKAAAKTYNPDIQSN